MYIKVKFSFEIMRTELAEALISLWISTPIESICVEEISLEDGDSLCFIPGHDGRPTDAIHTREEGEDGEENRCEDEFEFVQR